MHPVGIDQLREKEPQGDGLREVLGVSLGRCKRGGRGNGGVFQGGWAGGGAPSGDH